MGKLGFTAIILAAVLLTGCSQQYNAEKAYYRANRYSSDIFKDAKNIPPYQFEKAITNFQSLIDEFPETEQAAESYFKIGNLYVLQGKYLEAQTEFRKIMDKYSGKKDLLARATMAIAGCYEKTGDWPNTNKYLREAFLKYPDIPSTLPIPAGILTYYMNKKDAVGIERAYAQAVKDYKGIITKYPETPLAYSAQSMLVEVYMRGGDWAEVLATLNKLVKKYPKSPDAPTWLMTMGATYDVKMKDKVKAREMYQTVKNKYDQSPWAKEANNRLQAMK